MGAADDDAAAREVCNATDRIAARASDEYDSLADYARDVHGPGALADARARLNAGREGATGSDGASGASGGRDADALALRAMDGGDRLKAARADVNPSTFLRTEYGVDVRKSRYGSADDVHNEIRAALEDGR